MTTSWTGTGSRKLRLAATSSSGAATMGVAVSTRTKDSLQNRVSSSGVREIVRVLIIDARCAGVRAKVETDMDETGSCEESPR